VKYSGIVGTGGYLPEKVVTNADLEKMVDTTDAWILDRTGISQRHVADKDETTASMAYKASLLALEAASLEAGDIDMILLATSTPDRSFPSTACLLQEMLGIRNSPAFDLSAACSGFMYAMSVADSFIKTGMAKNVLVVGSELITRYVDWTDRSTCILFSDGAGAAILSAQDQPGILSTHIHADGRYKDLLYAESPLNDAAPSHHIQMKGNEVFKMAVNTLGKLVTELVAHHDMDKEAIDWLIPHQANHRIIQATARKLGLSMDQVIMTVNKHGNTSAASVPLALDHGVRTGKIVRGQLLLLEAFGAGFTWGSALIRY
jgi:3-oxoacyl-[acyl-carrier-protein] synthase III